MGVDLPDRIEQEILIDAAPERVWEAITAAEHLGTWFGDAGAEVDLRPGGRIVLKWKEHGEFFGRIEKVDPSQLPLRALVSPPEDGAPRRKLDARRVLPRGRGRTDAPARGRERVPAPLGHAGGERRVRGGQRPGWTAELAELRDYVTRLAGVSA